MMHLKKENKSKYFNLKLVILVLLAISYVLKLLGVW